MKVLRHIGNGFKEFLYLLLGILQWEPVFSVIMTIITAVILFAVGSMLFLAYTFCRNKVARAIGCDRFTIDLVVIYIPIWSLVLINIGIALWQGHRQYWQEHTGRFWNWSEVVIFVLLSVLVFVTLAATLAMRG